MFFLGIAVCVFERDPLDEQHNPHEPDQLAPLVAPALLPRAAHSEHFRCYASSLPVQLLRSARFFPIFPQYLSKKLDIPSD